VTLGAIRQSASVENSTTIRVTRAHDAEPVEAAVTTLTASPRRAPWISYASPQSFDLMPLEAMPWHPDAQVQSAPQHSDIGLRVTIENDSLTSIASDGAIWRSRHRHQAVARHCIGDTFRTNALSFTAVEPQRDAWRFRFLIRRTK
jgi:hypothetical protein